VRVVDLDWRSVVVLLAAFSGLVAFTALVHETPRSSTVIAIAVLLALALNPLVVTVQRWIRAPRSLAVVAVLTGFTGAVVLIGVLLVPPAVDQGRKLGSQLPEVVQNINHLPLVGHQLAKGHAAEHLQTTIEGLPDRLAGNTAPLERWARHLADGIVLGAVTLLLTVALLLDGERLLRAARRTVPPRRKEQADRLASLGYHIVGRYVAGSVLVAGVAGVVILIAGLVLGVPLAPLVAVWFALWDLVPQIGGAAGGVPFVLLGVTQGAGIGVICAVVVILYLQLKHQVLQPVLIGQAVKLSPPATMTAALVGIASGGVVGALLAVPLVGAAKAVYLELRGPRLHD
jgi:putative heme transporter